MKRPLFQSSPASALLILGLILITICCCYWPVLQADFLRWDDHTHLLENKVAHSLSGENIKEIFSQKVHHTYIPLTTLSFAVEYHFFGANPFIYHLTNLILHLLVVSLVFILALKWGLSTYAAAVGAFIFGTHPMHVESVAWITERKDLLYSLFYVLALIAYTNYLRTIAVESHRLAAKGIGWIGLTYIFGALSILAKPMAVSLPLILLLIDWFKKRKLSKAIFLDKVILAVLIAGVTLYTYMDHARVPSPDLKEAILVGSWTSIFYLRQFLLPLISVPIFRLPAPISFAHTEYALSLVAVILVFFGVFRLRKSRWLLFSFLYFLFSIFFLIRFDALKDTNIVADRFMYLPSLGFCLLIGICLERIYGYFNQKRNRLILRMIYVFCVFAVVVGMIYKTNMQTKVWQNDISLWQHQLRFFPSEPIALNGYVAALRKTERFQAAEREFKKIVQLRMEGHEYALDEATKEKMQRVEYLFKLLNRAQRVAPDYVDLPYKLGNLYKDVGLYNNALEMYQRAVQIDPGYKEIYLGLGGLYGQLELPQKAVPTYTRILGHPDIEEEDFFEIISNYNQWLDLYPESIAYVNGRNVAFEQYIKFVNNKSPKASSFFNLGYVFAESQELEGAVSAYKMALIINPNHVKSLYNLGNIYRGSQQWKEALDLYEKVIKNDPGNYDAYINIGIVYGRQGDIKQSQEYYKKAIGVDPANAKAYFNLAYTYEMQMEFDKAIEEYTKSSQADPKMAEPYYNIGNIYYKSKRPQEAISSYLQAVDLNPNHVDAWVNLTIISVEERDFRSAIQYYDEAHLLGFNGPRELVRLIESHRYEK